MRLVAVAALGRLEQLRVGAVPPAVDAVHEHLLAQRQQRQRAAYGKLQTGGHQHGRGRDAQAGGPSLPGERDDVVEHGQRAVQADDGLFRARRRRGPPGVRRRIISRHQRAHREMGQQRQRAADVVKVQMRQQQQVDVIDPAAAQVRLRRGAAGPGRAFHLGPAAIDQQHVLLLRVRPARPPEADEHRVASPTLMKSMRSMCVPLPCRRPCRALMAQIEREHVRRAGNEPDGHEHGEEIQEDAEALRVAKERH